MPEPVGSEDGSTWWISNANKNRTGSDDRYNLDNKGGGVVE